MILKALSRLYESGVRLRWSLYRHGALKSRKLGYPVISIGNLSLGGTGKTPFVAMLARYLQKQSFKPVILSRGYRGKRETDPLVVSNGEEVLAGPAMTGDEPYLLASELKGVPVVVGKNRFSAAQLVSVNRNTVFLLDDGFQHLALERDIDLLLIDAASPFNSDRVLPAGRLREPFEALKRADAFIITRAHLNNWNVENIERCLGAWNPDAPAFRSRTIAKKIKILGSDQKYAVESMRNRRFVALAAIGNPNAFLEDLKEAGVMVVRSFCFRDHHQFKQDELNRALDACSALNAEGIITTTKDAIRLQGLDFPPDRIALFEISTVMLGESGFFHWLDSRLESICKGPQPEPIRLG